MQRSLKQNDFLHAWCREMAEKMVEQGITINMVLSDTNWELNWNEELFKDIVVRGFSDRIFHKRKTSDLTEKEFSVLIDTIMDSFSKKFGVFVDFPEKHI